MIHQSSPHTHCTVRLCCDNQLPEGQKKIWGAHLPNALSKEGKLDYISLFGEESKPNMNLVKIYAKKHHDVPGPEKYMTTPKWVYSGVQQRKCKFLAGDRITSTEEVIQTAKRTKTPGPSHYKAKYSASSRERKVPTCMAMKSKTDQLQMFNDKAYHAKMIPGHKYHFNYVSRRNVTDK